MSDPILTQLEQRYQLPAGILSATEHVESGGRDVTSPAGAQGHFQLMPDTARRLVVQNPHDRVQAAEGAAKLWRQNLDATHGDVDRAAMMYHAGPDTRGWGPLTQAYPGKILAALQNGQADPAPQAAPEPAPQADATAIDRYLQVAEGAKSPADGGVSNGGGNQGGYRPTDGDSGPVGGVQVDANGGRIPGRSGEIPGHQQGLPGGDGEGPQESRAQAFGQGLADLYTGVDKGLDKFHNSIVGLGARATDAIGLTTGAHGQYNQFIAGEKPGEDALYNHPEGWARAIGEFAGEALPTAPVGEIKALQGLKVTSKLGQALARYGDYAIQGAGAGGLVSGGNDITKNMAIGAVAGPVVGGAVEAVAPPAIALAKALGRKLAPIGDAATSAAGKLAEVIKGSAPEPAFTPRGLREDFSRPDGSVDWEAAKAADAATAARGEAAHATEGLTGVVTDEGPLQVTPDMLAQAMGNRASKRGIEGTQALPEAVASRSQELAAQGVPQPEAMRQADIEAIPGATPAVGNVRRTPEDMRAMFEGAKADTPEGKALAGQIANNNDALHSHVQGKVEDLGGVPPEGSAAEEAATALAQASDAAKAKVTDAYTAARAVDGDQRVSIDGVRELLAKPDYKAPTTNEGRALVSGLNRQVSAMAKENGGRFSPEEIDQLTKAANAAYNPMGGGANHMVGEIKAALGESLDQFDKAGPAFKAARAAHRDWASQYDDPQGISSLIKRDAQGNFLRDDNWRAAETILGSKSDKSSIQIIRQLKKVGATDALNRLKATVIQRAYEVASQGAGDALGNQTLNGNRWYAELNKIGLPKLRELFSPQEVADLAHIGRVGIHLNEAIPGTVNTSGTAAALLNALGKQGKGVNGKAKVAVHAFGQILGTVGHLGAPGVGNVVGGVASKAVTDGADKLANGRAATSLAKALREQMDVNASRAAENDNIAAGKDASTRKAMARTLAGRAAPAANSRSKD